MSWPQQDLTAGSPAAGGIFKMCFERNQLVEFSFLKIAVDNSYSNHTAFGNLHDIISQK